MKDNQVKINKKLTVFKEEETILHILDRKGIHVPTLCHHEDFCAKGNCRVCVVDVKYADGKTKIVPSCATLAQAGMEILTDSERVIKSRNMSLELIYAEHIEKCATCVWRFECKLLKYAKDYKVLITTFKDRKGDRRIYKFKKSVELDGTQCIDCRNCIDACTKLQGVDHLKLVGKGTSQEVVPKKETSCILCGQCALHCPVSAAQEQTSWDVVEKILKNKNDKIAVAQITPSFILSLSEHLDLEYNQETKEKVVLALKGIGFDYVFDMNFGTRIAEHSESNELLRRIRKNELPSISSICPSAVEYIESYHPEFINNLSHSKSPHIYNAGYVKSTWSHSKNINPLKIQVVSILPCTSAKDEIIKKENYIEDTQSVDNVLTFREILFMFKKNNIDFKNTERSEFDDFELKIEKKVRFYEVSGSFSNEIKKNFISRKDNYVDFRRVSDDDGLVETDFIINGKKVRLLIVNGIVNFKRAKELIKDYDYIEIMACPDACIGGGGQLLPMDGIARKKIIEIYKELLQKKRINLKKN